MNTRISAKLTLCLALFCLQGCASFLQIGNLAEDPADYDRGYSREDDLEDESPTGAQSNNRTPASSAADELSYEQRRVKRAIETRDVVLGMTRKEVSESWGTPSQREVAGRGGGGHERWTYGSRFSLSGPRTVIFEDGRVAGWSQ